MHELLKDLNCMRVFEPAGLQTIIEKYGFEVVDFEHLHNAFILRLVTEDHIAGLVYVKPKKRWYAY
jgi:hypothetical protein